MTLEQIRQGFQTMASGVGPSLTNIAKVKSIDEANALCTLEDEDGQEILGVRLRAVLTGKQSFLQIPKIGSLVLAVRIEEDNDWLIVACDEVEKFAWHTQNAQMTIEDKFHLQAGGQNLAELMNRLFQVIEKGYQTNTGVTISLIMQPEFEQLKQDFKSLLK